MKEDIPTKLRWHNCVPSCWMETHQAPASKRCTQKIIVTNQLTIMIMKISNYTRSFNNTVSNLLTNSIYLYLLVLCQEWFKKMLSIILLGVVLKCEDAWLGLKLKERKMPIKITVGLHLNNKHTETKL